MASTSRSSGQSASMFLGFPPGQPFRPGPSGPPLRIGAGLCPRPGAGFRPLVGRLVSSSQLPAAIPTPVAWLSLRILGPAVGALNDSHRRRNGHRSSLQYPHDFVSGHRLSHQHFGCRYPANFGLTSETDFRSFLTSSRISHCARLQRRSLAKSIKAW